MALYLEWLRKAKKILIQIVVVSAEILTWYLHNNKQNITA